MYGSYGVGLGGAAYAYPGHGHAHGHAHAPGPAHGGPSGHGHPGSYGSSTWAAGAPALLPPAASLGAGAGPGGAGVASASVSAPVLPDVSASFTAAQGALGRRHVSVPDPAWWKKKVSIASAHKDAVRCVTWSPDGAWLATCGDESIKLWAPSRSTDARSARVLPGHTAKVNLLVWDPSNPRVLASAASDKTVRLWDVRAPGKPTASVHVPTSVLNMAFHPAGTCLAISDHDDRVSLLDPRTGSPIALVRDRKASKEEEVNGIAWTPDGRQFVLAKNKGAMEVLATAPIPARGADAQAEAGAGAGAHEAEGAGVSTDEASLVGWERTHLVRGHTSNLFALSCDPTNRYAVSGGADSVLALWRTSDWTSAGSYDGLTEMVRAVSFSYDGELIASLGEAGWITLVASQTMGAVAHLPFTGGAGTTLSWHPSRYTLAYASGKTPALVNVAGQI